MIINLTQHPASPEQVAAGVVNLTGDALALLVSRLTVDTLPTREEIVARCADIATLAALEGGDRLTAMIGGAPWMMAELEGALRDQGIAPVYAFSMRESVEQVQPDGAVRKINVFRHVGFVSA